MKFFRIRMRICDTFHETDIYNPQDIIGAESEEVALYLVKKEWENCGYKVLEVRSCEQIYPTAVFCERAEFAQSKREESRK